mgnify:CR=1 FL=1
MKKITLLCITLLIVQLIVSCSSDMSSVRRSVVEAEANPTPSSYSPARQREELAKRSTALQVADARADTSADEPEESANADVARMIIYTGNLSIQVVQPLEALKQATDFAKAQGGLIESTNYQDEGRRVLVVIRVPVKNFFSLMDALPQLGTVVSRSLSATDITRQFADLENRLQSARLLKQRLEALLAKVKNVDEKVKILREINRLAAQIEDMAKQSQNLSDRASMSTIVLNLTTLPRTGTSFHLQSPFGFIRSLSPVRRSIFAKSSLQIQPPLGFFDNTDMFDDGAAQQYFSADGTVFRSGQVENQPLGNPAFWKTALQREFARRSYQEVQSAGIADGHSFVYKIHDGLNIYYYGLSFRVTDDTIQIFEAFSPREDVFKKDEPAISNFLKSIKGK